MVSILTKSIGSKTIRKIDIANKNYNIFGDGGVEKVAKEFDKKFLGKIPIDVDLRKSADEGQPLFDLNPKHKISTIYKEIAQKIKQSF